MHRHHSRSRIRRLFETSAVLFGLMAVVPTAPASASASEAGAMPSRRSCATAGASTVTVGQGDSWFVIATSVGVGMSRLATANGAKLTTSIYPGDVLCLPSGATAPSSGQSGQSGQSSQSSSGSSSGCSATYVVERGDSWFAVADAVDVTLSTLLSANHATPTTSIQPGEQLCLPAGANAPVQSTKATSGSGALVAFPIEGPCWFGDTWHAPRGNGRLHEGVDLIAAQGQYVYAVVTGTLTQRAWEQPGLLAGNAWWLTSADASGTYFFYGHLYGFAPGLKVGSTVRAGEIIGFVGGTGSSATPHLHFEMHPGGGGAVNPYPTVKAMNGCRTGLFYQQPDGWTPEG